MSWEIGCGGDKVDKKGGRAEKRERNERGERERERERERESSCLTMQ